MNREREKMAYWYYLQQQKQQGKPPEKIYCKSCRKEIRPGSLPQFKYGVGIICYECYKKGSKLFQRKK
jgi:hypothetical protein